MGKIDDMRKQREAQHGRPSSTETSTPSDRVIALLRQRDLAAQAPSPLAHEEPPKARLDDARGKCAVCDKVRTLQNGLVTDHQKGLGKYCPGSRKEPA
ncbi:MAG TPA: hypothetical protein VJT73_21195 [Polyangiaceae bacterium]|nr:hypothetical protein [Polyangiaceae bacterium]